MHPKQSISGAYQIRTLEGCFFADARDDVVGSYIRYGRTWEFRETEWVKSILREGDLVIDAGANLGWYTVVMARHVGGSGRVFSFEPEPRNFQLLTKNVAWNGYEDRCSMFELALFDRESVHKFELSPDNLGDHRIRLESALLDDRENKYDEALRAEITVQAVTLDSVMSREAPEGSIRLWKMDTQGSEVSILRGAKQTLQRTEHLLVEYWTYAMERMGHNSEDFIACVQDYFDEFFRMKDGEPIFQPIDRLRVDLAIPPATPGCESMYVFRKAGLEDNRA